MDPRRHPATRRATGRRPQSGDGARLENRSRDHLVAGRRCGELYGSQDVGVGIGVAAVKNGTRVQLEMGGKNPLIVLDDADLATAVSVAVNGA